MSTGQEQLIYQFGTLLPMNKLALQGEVDVPHNQQVTTKAPGKCKDFNFGQKSGVERARERIVYRWDTAGLEEQQVLSKFYIANANFQ